MFSIPPEPGFDLVLSPHFSSLLYVFIFSIFVLFSTLTPILVTGLLFLHFVRMHTGTQIHLCLQTRGTDELRAVPVTETRWQER